MNVFYVTLLVLTTLIWGILFYKKDYHPQPVRVVLKSFGVGLFSMVPVFAYKYAYQHLLPQLSEFRVFGPLLDSPLWSGAFVFVLNLVMLSILLFGLSGLVSLVLNFFSNEALSNLKRALKQEPLGFTAVSLLIGVVIFTQNWIQNTWESPLLATILGSILFLAIIEEYVKHLIVRVTDDKRIKDVDDAITLSIVVGLAFAFTETLVYGIMAGDFKMIFFRTLVSLPVHVVASGIFGYCYGLAHFAKPIMALEKGGDHLILELEGLEPKIRITESSLRVRASESRTKSEKARNTKNEKRNLFAPLVSWFKILTIRIWKIFRISRIRISIFKIMSLKKSTIYSEKRIIEGFLFATAFHALANVLFELSLGIVAVPTIMLGVWFVLRLYKMGQREERLMMGWQNKKALMKVQA